MSSFELLSQSMQKKIWEMQWDRFNEIQDRTIPLVVETTQDLVIFSGTASGKTEAVFLPLISLIEGNAEEALKVLYISPLKALINDQFERIGKLCNKTNVPICRWHGDVGQGRKKSFIRKPAGILQITPESIESLFINYTQYIDEIFRGLKFIVIDEIHSFIGNERGVQLRSLLSRIRYYCAEKPRIFALSATIGNVEMVREWVNRESPDNVKVIEVWADKDILYNIMHFGQSEDGQLPRPLLEDIRELTRENKALIFCNSRSVVEESTYVLNGLAQRDEAGQTYYAHHSSIDKKEREYIEQTIAASPRPKSIVATSTLELGIDIGEVDLVIQVDSTFTVSSLKQRLGRSGRRRDTSHVLQLYSTGEDSLLRSLAVMELVLAKWVEPASPYALPYDILFHQILSLCAENNGLTPEGLLTRIEKNESFSSLARNDVLALVYHMLENGYLQKLSGLNQYIVGLQGETILRDRDFYGVFMSQKEYDVIDGVHKIGQLDKNAGVNEGDNLILSGRLWTVTNIDDKKSKMYVVKAVNGNPPRFSGYGLHIHKRIGEKVMEILTSDAEFDYLNDDGLFVLGAARERYRQNDVSCDQRVIWPTGDEAIFECYTGTQIARTLVWMLRAMGINAVLGSDIGRIRVAHPEMLLDILQTIADREWSGKELLLYTKERELFVSKFSRYLPDKLQRDMHVANEVDIPGVKQYLKRFHFRLIYG